MNNINKNNSNTSSVYTHALYFTATLSENLENFALLGKMFYQYLA